MYKRMIALCLCLVLILACFGCSASQETEEEAPVLQAGFGREDITPQNSVPMGGYGNSNLRMSEGVDSQLYATCIAFAYGEEKVLVFTVDMLNTEWIKSARPVISQATGVPQERILASATHTHYGPDLFSSDPAGGAYGQTLYTGMAKAAENALADLAPATLYAGKTDTEKLNFIRHFKLSDGSYGGSNFGDFENNTITGYAGEGDPQMLVLKIDREGDKQDIAMVNWQAHPCKSLGGFDNRRISADFIAPMRTTFEAISGMHFAYFTGAAGDQNVSTKITADDNQLSLEELGQTLAQNAMSAMKSSQKLEGEGIRFATETRIYPVNHDKEDQMLQAMEVVEVWKRTADSKQANALARQYGFSSLYEADAVRKRPQRPQSDKYEINALYVGGAAFVTASYEMFSASALEIKGSSPFETTFILSCANGGHGYFATEAAYDYGSYESATSYFAKGCAEDAVTGLLALLDSLK